MKKYKYATIDDDRKLILLSNKIVNHTDLVIKNPKISIVNNILRIKGLELGFIWTSDYTPLKDYEIDLIEDSEVEEYFEKKYKIFGSLIKKKRLINDDGKGNWFKLRKELPIKLTLLGYMIVEGGKME